MQSQEQPIPSGPGREPLDAALAARRDTAGMEYWRAERVARYLDISRKRVYQLIEEKKLEAVRLSPRTLRVMRASIDRYLADLQAAEATPGG